MIRPVNINTFNFKGKYMVQVPKNAFSEPNELEKCEDEFSALLSGEICTGMSFFQKKKERFTAFLESPNYASTVDLSSYGLDWIRAHTGVDVKAPKDPNYHTFLVLTKEENEKMVENFKGKKLKKIEKAVQKEENERYKNGLITDAIWQQAIVHKYFSEIADEVCKNVETNETIILNNLDEIPFAVSEMDI